MKKPYLTPTIHTLHLGPSTVLAASKNANLRSRWDEYADEVFNSKAFWGSTMFDSEDADN